MDSLFLFQFACIIFMLVNAFFVALSHLHVRWENKRYFIFIVLIGLSACTGKQTELNMKSMKVEKKWAKDCDINSKIHILADNARFSNEEKVLTSTQTYINMSKDCLNEVEALVAKYIDEKDNNHYFANNNPLDCYFRQYLCYKENKHIFVFVNLYAYKITRYDTNTTTAFASNPLVHVINPLKGNNKDYKILIVNLSERSIRISKTRMVKN